eukprot:Gb_40717 [translate_table: standard]
MHETTAMRLCSLLQIRTLSNMFWSECIWCIPQSRRFITKKNKYGYMSVGAPLPKISSVVKLDFERAKWTPELGDAEEWNRWKWWWEGGIGGRVFLLSTVVALQHVDAFS